MEHSVDTLTAPKSRVETPEVTLVEQKIANLCNVISSDHEYLIGSEAKRTEFQEVLSKVHDDIDNTFTFNIEASKVHKEVDLMVAKCFDVAVRKKFESIKAKKNEDEIIEETNNLVEVVINPPVGLVASKPQIDKWHNEALNVQKEVRSQPSSKHQSNEQIVADSYSRVAAAYGAGIPAAKNGKQTIESGDDYKLEWVESERKKALGKDPESIAKFDAINRISVVAYSVELNDPNALVDKVKSVTRKAVAGVALAGVISTMSSVVANADPGAKTTEIVPDSTKKLDKAVSLDEKVTIVPPKPTTEPKVQPEAPAEQKQDNKDKVTAQVKTDKKVDPKALEGAITIAENLTEKPVATPAKPTEKTDITAKNESENSTNDSKKTEQDKTIEVPEVEPSKQDVKSEDDKKEQDAKDHAIVIDPSELTKDQDDATEDKTHGKKEMTTEPVIDQPPKDTVKDKVISGIGAIIDGVIRIDKDTLDADKDSDTKTGDDNTEEPKDDQKDSPAVKVVDGVVMINPADVGEDKTADTGVLISPSFEIPKPPIIEIPTYRQDTQRQEQGPSTPQGDYTQAADKLAAKGGVWDRVSVAMNFFMNDQALAMTPSQAAGLIGNLMGETYGDMNPGQSQSGGPAFGIAQWEGGRLMDLGAFAGKNQADFKTQLEFIKYELLGKERHAFNMLKTAKNREEAAVLVREYYERPSAHRDDERKAYANQVGDAFNAEYQAILASRAPKQETNSNGILAGWPTTGEAAMKLFNQCDPRWGEIRTPNGVRACDVSCGPTSVAMAVNALTGKDLNPGDVIRMTNDKRMWLPGDQGTSFDAVINLGKNFGINGAQMQNFKDINAYREILKNGGMILVAGSGPAPFVAPSVGAHFVLIRGITEDGKFLVADPYPKTPDTNTGAWDAQPILNGTFGAVVFTK